MVLSLENIPTAERQSTEYRKENGKWVRGCRLEFQQGHGRSNDHRNGTENPDTALGLSKEQLLQDERFKGFQEFNHLNDTRLAIHESNISRNGPQCMKSTKGRGMCGGNVMPRNGWIQHGQ